MPSPANPFTVQTPEDLPAKDAVDLFVPMWGDFPKVRGPGHLYLHGPRGSGKSMMFRFLRPDCQLICGGTSHLADLDSFAIYVSCKNLDLKLTELRRLEGQHASVILNEHFLTLYIAAKAVQQIAQAADGDECVESSSDDVRRFCSQRFADMLSACGHPDALPPPTDASTVADCLSWMERVVGGLFSDVTLYLKRMAFRPDMLPFHGPLCGYLDFLHPLLTEMNRLPFMPGSGKPVLLLIDDADNLSDTQTMVLNTWVSSRTTSQVSIKASTQGRHRYKTWLTATGQTIDTPHDYAEVSISAIYTTRHQHRYRDRVREVVRRRLHMAGVRATPEEFFPPDEKQLAEIEAIDREYRDRRPDEGRGYRPGDDAYRYARPDYMRKLAGTAKSGSTYSYSGFDQLVHISSGIIRYFLEAAAEMYGTEMAKHSDGRVSRIPPGVQSDVVRSQADDFLFLDMEKLGDDRSDDAPGAEEVTRLNRLVRCLGELFRKILLSDRSERRVFSVALYDEPGPRLDAVLKLGEQYGYFHRSAIGNKEGTGRVRLYVLSRRLAPAFSLDPTSFAGYLFMHSQTLQLALESPRKFRHEMEKRLRPSGDEEDPLDAHQLALFDEGRPNGPTESPT